MHCTEHLSPLSAVHCTMYCVYVKVLQDADVRFQIQLETQHPQLLTLSTRQKCEFSDLNCTARHDICQKITRTVQSTEQCEHCNKLQHKSTTLWRNSKQCEQKLFIVCTKLHKTSTNQKYNSED